MIGRVKKSKLCMISLFLISSFKRRPYIANISKPTPFKSVLYCQLKQENVVLKTVNTAQSTRYDSKLEAEKRIAVDKVISEAKEALASGSSRFCMGAAWRNPHERDMPYVLEMVKEVKALGLETCMTLGMLNESQAGRLKDAGLDYYNHNLDTSREYYSHIISTRTFDDRLNTLEYVRQAGMKVCRWYCWSR